MASNCIFQFKDLHSKRVGYMAIVGLEYGYGWTGSVYVYNNGKNWQRTILNAQDFLDYHPEVNPRNPYYCW
jgi:hypothetical protein